MMSALRDRAVEYRGDAGERRSTPLFFILVFALSMPFLVLQGLTGIELLPGLPLASLVIVVPATVAAVLMFRSGGMRSLARLFARCVDAGRTKSLTWHFLAVLLPLAVAVLSFWILRWSGTAVPGPSLPSLPNIALFGVFLLAALGEELGWMGYAYDPLEGRFGTLAASLILGVVWALWHFVPLLQVGRSMAFIAWWTIGTAAMRIVMVWLYRQAVGSVLTVALFHAVSNLCCFGEVWPWPQRRRSALSSAMLCQPQYWTNRRARWLSQQKIFDEAEPPDG